VTRLPTESRNYRGLGPDDGEEYIDYKVGPLCSVPGCARLADHGHHLVRRSELGGPYFWVRMPDGNDVGNVTALCFSHHNDVTENRSHIQYADGIFYWCDDETHDRAKELVPQPPHLHTDDETIAVLSGDSVIEEREVCPGCGRKLPKPKIETPQEEKKPRGTWAIAIPMDERENGANVLDEMLETIREKLDSVGVSYSEASNAKYYVLSTGMGLLVQHFDSVVADA